MSSEFQSRLRKNLEQPTPAQHPAPDVLSAYSDRALTAAEEQQVTSHLAACAECREVVYLASAAAEEEPATVAPKAATPSKVRWWTWAVPLVAVLTVGTTVFVFRAKTNSSTQAIATYITPAAPASQPEPVETKAKPPVATSESPAKQLAKAKQDLDHPPAVHENLALQTGDGKDAELKSADLAANKKEAPAGIGGRVAANPQSLAAANAPARPAAGTRDQLASTAAPAPAPTASPTTTSVEVTAEAVPTFTDAQPQQAEVARAKTAPTGNYAAGNVMMRKMPAMKAAVPAPWAATSSGKLERFDGKIWKPLDVDPAAFFLTVTNVGSDVWAGGRNMVLLHSADDGATWEHQSVPGDKPFDIVHVEFRTALEGVLKTSAGYAFTTHDGGKTWIAVPTR